MSMINFESFYLKTSLSQFENYLKKTLIYHISNIFTQFLFCSFFLSLLPSLLLGWFLASLRSFKPVTSSVNFLIFSYYSAKTQIELASGFTSSFIFKGSSFNLWILIGVRTLSTVVLKLPAVNPSVTWANVSYGKSLSGWPTFYSIKCLIINFLVA